MKYTICIIILILNFGCSRIRVADEPVTLIKGAPNRINSLEFAEIIKKLRLYDLYEAPDYYGGLIPKYKLVRAFSEVDTCNCLNLSHGFWQVCESIIVNIEGDYLNLKSKEEFQKCFAPIETEEEALSYVAIWTNTIPVYDFDIKYRYRKFVKLLNKSFVEEVEGGFITLTYYYELFGCGPHSHYSVKSFVDFEGNVEEFERVKIYEDPREDGLCVD